MVISNKKCKFQSPVSENNFVVVVVVVFVVVGGGGGGGGVLNRHFVDEVDNIER